MHVKRKYNISIFFIFDSNSDCMKKKLLFAAVFVAMTLSFTSCEESCKICKKVKYDSAGNYVSEESEAEYCGVELIAIDGKTVDLGSLGKAKWECR